MPDGKDYKGTLTVELDFWARDTHDAHEFLRKVTEHIECLELDCVTPLVVKKKVSR